jgi:dihydroxyacetone kinase-like protein
MTKIMNSPERYVDDMLDGLLAFAPSLRRDETAPRVVFADPQGGARRVGIATGGGSGHLPLFVGYVGQGLVDSCAIGNVFEGPSLLACERAIRCADRGAGVLCLLGNYGGDRMNFALACDEMPEGIPTRTVLGTDDIASAAPDEADRRRGVAGLIVLYKVAGHAAASGAPLDEVAGFAAHANARTRTIGATFGPCQLPGSERPNFDMRSDEVEMGMGIHGEPGLWRRGLPGAHALAADMIDRLLADPVQQRGDEVVLLINSLGATPLEELLILYCEVLRCMTEQGIRVHKVMLGTYVTSLEMPGVSLSLTWLDAELKAALSSPATPVFTQAFA